MTPKLEQDVGPPKATPERLTRAKQSVEFADDKVPVVPTRQFGKPFEARLKTSLLALVANWLTHPLSDEPLAAKRVARSRSASHGTAESTTQPSATLCAEAYPQPF